MNTDNGRESYSLGLDINQMLRDARRAENAFQSIGNKAVSEGAKIDKTFRTIGAGIAGYFTVGALKDFGKAIIDARSEIESFQISFETLIGSKDKANAFFSELKDFAVNTPLLLNDLAKGGQLLLGFGLDLDKVMPTLKQIGDISMGNADRFNSLTLAFAQMSATGKLMGQDLLQMINAGFNPLTVMAQTTGKSVATLKDEMSKGAISADMVAKAFADATAEGGKFNGMLEKQSKGIRGSISNLEGAIQDALNDMGEKGQTVITEGISLATTAVKNYEKLGGILMGMIATYGMYKVAVILATEAEKGYTISQTLNIKVLMLAEKAQKLLNKTMLANPYVLAAVALGALITATLAYSKSSTVLADELERVNDREKTQADLLKQRKAKIEELITAIQDENTTEEEKHEKFNELKVLMPSIFKQYKTEKELIEHLTEARKAYNNELREEKTLKGVENLTDDKKRLSDLKEYLRLRKEYTKYGRMRMSDDDFKKYSDLDKKYKPEVQKSRGTFQLYNSAIEEMIKSMEGTINKDTEAIRADAQNKWETTVSSMNADTAKKMAENYSSLLKLAKDTGKKWAKIQGEAVPVSTDVLAQRIKMLNERAKSLQENAAKDFLKDSKAAWESAKKATKDIIAGRNDRTKYPDEAAYQAALEKARQEEAAAKKKYENMGGETSSKKENAAKKAQEEANELKVEQAERLQKIAEYDKELANQEKQSAFEIRQSRIDGLKEGFEKEKEQIDLNYDRLIEANRLRQEQWVKELQDKQREEWINENPNYKKEGKIFTPSSTVADLSASQQKQLKEYTDVANEYQKTANDKLLKDLFDKYKNYEQRRTEINKQYDAERKAIENGKTVDGKDIAQDVKDAALVELEIKRKEAIKSVNDEEIATMQKSSDLLVKLFEGASNKSVSEINKIMSQTEQMLSYLSKTKAEDITPNFGFTAEQLKALKASPKDIKAIQDAVEQLYSAGVKKNPFSALIKGIKDLFKSGEDSGNKSTEAKLAKIGEAAAEAANMVGNMAGSLSDMFEAMGNNGAAEAMDTVQDVMSAVSNIGEGFAKGGIVGGIAAAVGEAANFIGKAFAAEARHQAALKEIMKETISQQRAYNLLLMQQNLEYERATTIFGTDAYGKATNAIKVMKQAIADLNKELAGTYAQKAEQRKATFMQRYFGVKDANAALKQAYAGLADIEIKTGHKKTGLFGWGKGKDIYSSILSVYPKLIDQNGKFNASLAETIISTRTMSDEDKAALQNMIDLSKQAEEALQAVKDYLTDIFGELGNTMSDALVDAFKNGTDAAEAFTKSVSGMLEKLAKEMIYTVTIAPYIEQAQEQMLGVMKDDSLTDEQKFNSYVSILDGLTSGVLSQQETFNALLQKYQEMAANKGINIFQPDEEERKASSKTGITASQDSVDEMSGRVTTIQGHTYTINENVKVLVAVSSQALEKLTSIDRNTKELCDKTDKVIEQNDSIKKGVESINTRGVTIKK
ncbi:tape measure protein [Bacteroides fragilis]|uniref:tape measure protein n=1 Tax=Bacteroides fragilis TaxID=817 RepID=UPI001C704613|nr:tape measure protein [Bacteroides fragilis]MBW9276721.1 tape measure protein [Bacteroides fragilis]